MLEKELKKKLEGVPVKTIVHTENYGDVIVYDDRNKEDGKRSVEFINTGYITRARLSRINRSDVKDKLYKNIFNIACLGYAEPTNNVRAHAIWRILINKCYNPNDVNYKNYGAKGYSMCERWLRFDLFLEDYNKYNRPEEYQTIFTIKPGEKEFCFENCEFVSMVKQKDPDEIHHTLNYGDYKIIGRERDKNGILKYKIKFLLTGYETLVNSSKIKDMNIRDPYYPSVCGVGYIGEGEYTHNEKYYKRERKMWEGMIRRCYKENDKSYKMYGGAGVTVHPDWLNLNTFIHDIKQLENYQEWKNNPGMYQLDKDLLQMHLPKSQKVYSKDTCKFVLKMDNFKYRCEEILVRNGRKYYGISSTIHNTYKAHVQVNGIKTYIGTFDDLIAAANARDWWAKYYGSNILNSDLGLPYMPPEEWVKHRRLRIGKEHKQMYTLKPRQLYHLIDKEEDENEGSEDNNEG